MWKYLILTMAFTRPSGAIGAIQFALKIPKFVAYGLYDRDWEALGVLSRFVFTEFLPNELTYVAVGVVIYLLVRGVRALPGIVLRLRAVSG